jgi:hypothetical protein
LNIKAQWQHGEGLAADSCGRSSGIGLPSRDGNSHRIPFCRPTRAAHLNAAIRKSRGSLVNAEYGGIGSGATRGRAAQKSMGAAVPMG